MQENEADLEKILKLNLWNFLCAEEKLKSTQNTPVEEYRRLFQNLLTFKDIKPISLKEPVDESDPNYWHINYTKDKDWEKRMDERGFHTWYGKAEGKKAHQDEASFTMKGDKVLLSPYLAIQCIGDDIGDLASLMQIHEDSFDFYLRKITDYVPTLKDISQNFLVTEDFEHFLLKSYKNERVEDSKIYRNLTICPLIESIRRYYVSQGNMILKSPRITITDISDPDEQILWALGKLRDGYFAHNDYFPDFRVEPEKIKNISILFKDGELNKDLVEKVLKKAVSKCVGISDEKVLIKDLKQQKFLNLTETDEYSDIKDYVTATNELYDYIENVLKVNRKDAGYLYGSMFGTEGITETKSERDKLLHVMIKTKSREIHIHDPEIPMLILDNLKMYAMCFGRDKMIEIMEEFKQKKIELKKENENRLKLRGRLRKASTLKKRSDLISQLIVDTPRRKEEAEEIKKVRRCLRKDWGPSFVPIKVKKEKGKQK